MAWWDNPTTPYALQAADTIAGQRFSQFDSGGDFDVDGIPGIGLSDYYAFLGTYLGGDAANFGQPGYEQGTQFLAAPRVAPQATASPYQQVALPDGTRYYGNQQQAGNQAFRQNNPVTAAQVPVGQSQRLAAQAPPAPAPVRPQQPMPVAGGMFGSAPQPQYPNPAAPRPPSRPLGTGRLGGY